MQDEEKLAGDVQKTESPQPDANVGQRRGNPFSRKRGKRVVTLDLFGYEKPRKDPELRMIVTDCGENGSGQIIACFRCPRCARVASWVPMRTITEVKIGLACPRCNLAPGSPRNHPNEVFLDKGGGRLPKKYARKKQ